MPAPVSFARFEIRPLTGLIADGTWNTVDMSPYIANNTARAVMIVAQLENDTARDIGAAPTNASPEQLNNSKQITTNVGNNQWLVPLNENKEIQIYIEAGSQVTFYYAGEVRDGFVDTPDTMIEFPHTGNWYRRTVLNVTPGDSGNIEAVILQLRLTGDNTPFVQGLSPTGVGGIGWQEDMRNTYISWHCVKVDSDNNFAIFSDFQDKGQESLYQQIGYIKKGYGFTATDPGLSRVPAPDPNGQWNDLVLSTLPENTTGAFITLFHDAGDTGLAWKRRGIRGKEDLSGGNTLRTKGMAITIGVHPDDDRTVQSFKWEEIPGSASLAVSGYSTAFSTYAVWDLQQAVYDLLSEDIPLAGFVAGRIFDAVPSNAEFPYVVLEPAIATAADTQGESGLTHSLTLHSWSRHRGDREMKHIMQTLHDALHNKPLDLIGNDIITVRQVFSTVQRDPDGFTRHGIQRFEIVTTA